MPSSRPNAIPTVIHLLRQVQPRSILDVGVGFGKWGHLFREYTDINAAEQDPRRYHRRNWQVRIDGIEGHAGYLTAMHRYFYNHIYQGDALALLPTLSGYDLVFLGDVIEHFEKKSGRKLLRAALRQARRAVIVTTPKDETDQADLCGNELERHRSRWTSADFLRFARAQVKTIDRATLLAVLPKPGLGPLLCRPPVPPRASARSRLRQAAQELASCLPPHEPFILIDEEQIRTQLPHTAARPFLEQNGVYWGPPGDDAKAIRECQRLRRAGARSLAFIWSTFWWLQHYRGFAAYLRGQFRCVHRTDRVIIFDLGRPARARFQPDAPA